MNHLMQELKYPVKLDNFKRLQPEEIEKYREFSKNYVFAGDQFLYVNVSQKTDNTLFKEHSLLLLD